MKERIKYLAWIAPISIMILIFMFSAAEAKESSQLSGSLCSGIVEGMSDTFSLEWDTEKIKEVSDRIEYPIRKMAHMSEYAALGVAMLFAFYVNRIFCKKQGWVALLCCTLYAATDEIHQLFVPGRDGNLFDVGVDTVGAGIGILCLLGIIQLWKYYNKKSDTNNK